MDAVSGIAIDSLYRGFDTATGGISRCGLLTVVSREEEERHAFTISLMYHMAGRLQLNVLCITTEQAKARIYTDLHTIHAQHFKQVQSPLREPVIYDNLTTMDAVDEVARYRRRMQPFDFLVVTGALNLTGVPGPEESWDDAIGDVSRRMKLLAKDLNVPVVTTLYPGRAPRFRPLTLNDLGPADDFAGDSDYLLFVASKNLGEPHEDRERIDVVFAKNRFGPAGCRFTLYRDQKTPYLWENNE